MTRTKILLLAGAAFLSLHMSDAFAQTITDLNSANPNNGVRITSNADNNDAAEFFQVLDSGYEVIHADGDVITRLSNQNNLVLNYDQDDDDTGSFSLQSGGASVLSADNGGAVTVYNAMTTNGIDNGGDGITNAGAISGVTTFAADSNGTLAGGHKLVVDTNGVVATSDNGFSTSTINNTHAALNHTSGANISNIAANATDVTLSRTNGTGLTSVTLQDEGLELSRESGAANVKGMVALIDDSATIGFSNGTGSSMAVFDGANAVIGYGDGSGVHSSAYYNSQEASMAYVSNVGGNPTTSIVTADGTGINLTRIGANNMSSVLVGDFGVALVHAGENPHNIILGDKQTVQIGENTLEYGTSVLGGMYIEGDLGVNGSIYSMNPNGSTGLNVADNGLTVKGGTNTTTLVADSNSNKTDGRAQIELKEDQASFLVYNKQNGNPHGVQIGQTKTTISGGTRTTTMTLSDDGVSFYNSLTGGAARVTGVADGQSDFDAVNYRQLRNATNYLQSNIDRVDKKAQKATAGVASVAAMGNIPNPAAGKRFSLGVGFGHFESESAFALGGIAAVTDNISLKTSFGHADDANVFGAGVGFSW